MILATAKLALQLQEAKQTCESTALHTCGTISVKQSDFAW